MKTRACVPACYEEWRTIPGFSDYSASSFGRIRRETASPKAVAGHIKRLSYDGRYQITRLYTDDGRLVSRRIHILVALAFLGPKPDPTLEVNHLDGDKLNNVPSNLEYITSYENEMHAKRLKLKAHGAHWYEVRGLKVPA